MKRLTNFLLPVEIGMDLTDVESIRFKFAQGIKSLVFDYPSAKVTRPGSENVLLLRWSVQDTAIFESGKKLEMDTFIKIIGSDENPWTDIVSVIMDRTLFTPEEVDSE